MDRLAGKCALITGGSSGIGLATARAFLEEGATVAITGRDRDKLAAAGRALGGTVLAVPCDVSSTADLDRLFAQIHDHFGGLDVLFANAGVIRYLPFDQISEAVFDETFAINVRGTFFTIQKGLTVLRPGSAVILNSSVAARAGTPGGAIYGPSKAAVRVLARNLAAELAPRGIRINVVSPGPIDTSTPESAVTPRDAHSGDSVALTIPLGRMGTPREVAQAVVFLASPESSFMLGAELVVDGGRMQLPDGAPVDLALRALGAQGRADLAAAYDRAIGRHPGAWLGGSSET